MGYDDKVAWEKLREAIKISEECDPADCDCENCPIGKPLELIAHDAGVKVVASACSFISMLKDAVFDPHEYRYKED